MPLRTETLDAARRELDRVLASEAFRNSDSLRHLLAYLADMSLADPPVELKEYTIGTQACGKPDTYDPQRDASVRVQVGRLRQKLEEYYKTEGENDPVILDLPKGRFTLFPRVREKKEQPDTSLRHSIRDGWLRMRGMRRATVILLVLLAAALVQMGLTWQRMREHETRLRVSDQEETIRRSSSLWGPFFSHSVPSMAIFGSPQFFASGRLPLFVRLYTTPDPEDPTSSPHFQELNAKVGPLVGPRFDYASMGDAVAVQRLTSFFGSAGISLKALPAHMATWETISDGNLIFVGASRMHPLLRRLPVTQDFELGPDDQVHNRSRRPGEAEVYTTQSHRDSMTYAVVALYPGLKPGREVFLLTAHSSPGAMAAADFVSNPGSLKVMEEKIGLAASGRRKYFQMLLRVYVDKDVPVKTEYVTHHMNP